MAIDEAKLNDFMGNLVHDIDAFEVAVAQFRAIPKMVSALRTGLGLGWHEHDAALFRGTERSFRPGYAASPVSQWIPGLGAQAGEARLRDVVTGGGFTRFRRATETAFNLVFEARP